MPVPIGPGQMQFTVIPSVPNSTARERVKPMTPVFAVVWAEQYLVAFGFACGPAQLFDHGTTPPGRYRFPEAFVPRKTSEGAASAVCSRLDLLKLNKF